MSAKKSNTTKRVAKKTTAKKSTAKKSTAKKSTARRRAAKKSAGAPHSDEYTHIATVTYWGTCPLAFTNAQASNQLASQMEAKQSAVTRLVGELGQ